MGGPLEKDGPLKYSPISVAAFPVAWRIEIVDDDNHRDFEYIRSELDVTQCVGAER